MLRSATVNVSLVVLRFAIERCRKRSFAEQNATQIAFGKSIHCLSATHRQFGNSRQNAVSWDQSSGCRDFGGRHHERLAVRTADASRFKSRTDCAAPSPEQDPKFFRRLAVWKHRAVRQASTRLCLGASLTACTECPTVRGAAPSGAGKPNCLPRKFCPPFSAPQEPRPTQTACLNQQAFPSSQNSTD